MTDPIELPNQEDLLIWYKIDDRTCITDRKGQGVMWINSAQPEWKITIISRFWKMVAFLPYWLRPFWLKH